jgi:formylglycine-generating enzyme required for sulfatase activity
MYSLSVTRLVPRVSAPVVWPVAHVDWADATAYVAWADLALPTEAQWERAAGWDARAHHARRYSWGDDEPGKGTPRVGNLADESLRPWRGMAVSYFEGYDDGFKALAPVGSFPAGASPVGALDMCGNTSELCRDTWTEDMTAFVAQAPRRDPCNHAPGGAVTQRGGNFADAPALFLVAHRAPSARLGSCDRLGFRVARSLNVESLNVEGK